MDQSPKNNTATNTETSPENKHDSSLDTSMDVENIADVSNSSMRTEKMFPNSASKISSAHSTPDAVRTRRQIQENYHVSSPSDSMLSPCTAKLFGRGGKKAVSGPAAALRKKQVTAIPFKLGE